MCTLCSLSPTSKLAIEPSKNIAVNNVSFFQQFSTFALLKKERINACTKQHKQRNFHYGRTIDAVHNRLHSFDHNHYPLRGSNVICGFSNFTSILLIY